MRYERRFTIHASHFNSQKEYDAYGRIRDGLEEPGDAMTCIKGIHGHNFIITVSATGRFIDSKPWLADDEIIESLINRWNNTNLSVHDDFIDKRATTENMVRILLNQLHLVERRVGWTVAIQETDDIMAEDSI